MTVIYEKQIAPNYLLVVHSEGASIVDQTVNDHNAKELALFRTTPLSDAVQRAEAFAAAMSAQGQQVGDGFADGVKWAAEFLRGHTISYSADGPEVRPNKHGDVHYLPLADAMEAACAAAQPQGRTPEGECTHPVLHEDTHSLTIGAKWCSKCGARNLKRAAAQPAPSVSEVPSDVVELAVLARREFYNGENDDLEVRTRNVAALIQSHTQAKEARLREAMEKVRERLPNPVGDTPATPMFRSIHEIINAALSAPAPDGKGVV